MVRSIVSVLAGFVVWSVIWLVAGQGVRAAMSGAFAEDGSTSSVGVSLLMLVASVICSLAAGYVAALVARGRILTHGLVLGIILLAVGVMVEIQHWTKMPLWYHLVFLVLLIPVTVGGAAMRRARLAVREP
ncbi:MAG: hypothetical protein JSU68_09130 [Phycisphaerales bacterium]|nr:MAG: hypothetical protein JSU68_09130 [Phycisphaerales bacterium]